MEEPYSVEVETGGCLMCGAGRLWAVVGPDGIAQSTMFEDESDAADLAALLSEAFRQGMASVERASSAIAELTNATSAVDPVEGLVTERPRA